MKADRYNMTYNSPNIESKLITPFLLKRDYPLSEKSKNDINEYRKTVSNIIKGQDSRLLVICGPCSIHDYDTAIDYANRLKKLSDKVNQTIFIVMRTYFEKPRTTIGWKGFINDPDCDGTCDIKKGLRLARQLSVKLTKIGVPLASEALDPNLSYYFDDIFSWASIGARTTESQIHREMASGLPMPIGFKNNTNGSVTVAINAIKSASYQHSYIGINQEGDICQLKSTGNLSGHVILRGGTTPNYHHEQVQACIDEMIEKGVYHSVVVDCSHGNSNKDYRRQEVVAHSVVYQRINGNKNIVGLMIESHINEGNQPLQNDSEKLQYGVSITDGCINWQRTNALILDIHEKLQRHLQQ